MDQIKISIIGLGYVGLPLAVEFAKHFEVTGFDICEKRISELKQNIDSTDEVPKAVLESVHFKKTTNESEIKESNFYIIAVPTPITDSKRPDLEPLRLASEILGRQLSPGDVVVYESTVYPGLTEEYCVPIIEKVSGLKCGKDWKVGYSPERINPGDKEHTIGKIIKVVSGIDEESVQQIAEIYSKIVPAGIHKSPNIKTAEAAKVIENIQRDLNIALTNEFAKIFQKLKLDTKEVLDAAGTKWNFLKFYPGLVGGHCIGVDPYYLTEKAQEVDYHPEIILAGRRLNDSMGKYVADLTINAMIAEGMQIKNSRILIMGLTFKENVSDTRNSRVADIVKELAQHGIQLIGHDPLVSSNELFGVPNIHDYSDLKKADAIIFAVNHEQFKNIKLDDLKKKTNILIDVRWIFDKKEAVSKGFKYVRL